MTDHIAKTKIREDKTRAFLSGTTCHWNCSVFRSYSDGRYVVMRHKGHSSYCGRFTGNVWCAGYYVLYDLDSVAAGDLAYGPDLAFRRNTAMKVWNGRWTKARELEARALVGEGV